MLSCWKHHHDLCNYERRQLATPLKPTRVPLGGHDPPFEKLFYRRPVLKCNGYLQSLPACLSELLDSLALRLFSDNGQRDIDLHKYMIRSANLVRGRARYISGEVGHHEIQKGGFAIDRNLGGKVYRLCLSHVKSRKCFAELS